MCIKRYEIFATCYDRQGRVISVGTNSYKKSHPLMKELAIKTLRNPHKVYLHAEVSSILKAGDKKIHSIMVQRFTAEGKPALAKPCPICQEAIRMFGIREVKYTSSSGEIVKERIK